MKNIKKLLRMLIAIAMVVVMAFGTVACGGGDQGGNGGDNGGGSSSGGNGGITITPLPGDGSQGGVTESPIVLGASSLNLIVGDIFQPLTSSTAGVTWSSLDENIATVIPDEQGNAIIEALNVGTTKIVAEYGRASATCDISVAFDDALPVLGVKSLKSEDEANSSYAVPQLSKGATFKFEPTITYNNRVFTDGEYTFEVSNSEYATISEDGELTISQNVPKGATVSVTVSASWRGKDTTNCSQFVKTYTFGIIDEVFIAIDGVQFNEMELYITDSFEGATFTNKASVTTSVYVNNVLDEDAVVAMDISNPEYISYDQDKNEFTGVKFGSGVVTLTYTFNDGEEEIPVTTQVSYRVLRPYADFSSKANFFSAISGNVKDDRVAGQLVTKNLAQFIYGDSTDKVIIDAEIDNDLLSAEQKRLQVKDNKVLGLSYLSDTTDEVTIKVGFEDAIWYVDLTVYGLYITEATDFDNLLLSASNKQIDAYVELGCNIDASNYVMRDHFAGSVVGDICIPTNAYAEGQATGFSGVFEGNGFVVNNLSTGLYGLFGAMTEATVKNVAFNNCGIDGAAFFTMNMNKCNFENVYVSVAKMARSSHASTSTISGNHILGGTFKNMVVVNSLTNTDLSLARMSFAPIRTKSVPVMTNVFVISPLQLGTILYTGDLNVVTFAVAENKKEGQGLIDTANGVYQLLYANAYPTCTSILNQYKTLPGNENAVIENTDGNTLLQVVENLKPNMKVELNGLRTYANAQEFVNDADAQAAIKLFDKAYWTVEAGQLSWGSSKVADGEIYIDFGEMAGKNVTGALKQRLTANAGNVELPELSYSGFDFLGYEVIGSGVRITKTEGKYILNFDGTGTIVKAIWQQKSNVIITPTI